MALQLFDDFEDESTYYAIQTNGIDEAKFIFLLNKLLNFSFRRIHDLDVTIKGNVFCFSLYEYNNDIDAIDYYIFKNLSHPKKSSGTSTSLFDDIAESEFILKKYKGFDYIVKIPSVDGPVLLNDVSLHDAAFIQNYTMLENLTAKEKNLLTL